MSGLQYFPEGECNEHKLVLMKACFESQGMTGVGSVLWFCSGLVVSRSGAGKDSGCIRDLRSPRWFIGGVQAGLPCSLFESTASIKMCTDNQRIIN